MPGFLEPAAGEVLKEEWERRSWTKLPEGGGLEAEGNISSVKSKLDQARSDLKRMLMITKGGEDLISERDIELYESRVEVIEGELVSAIARRAEVLAEFHKLLPARKKTAEDALAQAKVELEKMVVYADISGRVTQLVLQPGDIVNPLLRPAGLLVPEGDVSVLQTASIICSGDVISPIRLIFTNKKPIKIHLYILLKTFTFNTSDIGRLYENYRCRISLCSPHLLRGPNHTRSHSSS